MNLPKDLIQQDQHWYSAYKKHYLSSPQKTDFSLKYENSSAFLFFPLMLWEEKKGPAKDFVIRALAQGPSDFYRPIHKGLNNSELVRLTCAYLKDHRHEWDRAQILNCVKDGFPFEALIEELHKSGFEASFEKSSGHYFADCSGDYTEFYESFIKSNNKDLLKDLRRLDRKEIDLSIESIRQNVYQKLSDVLDIYAQRRESLGQANSYEDTSRQGFVKDVVNAYEKEGKVELTLLKDQNNAVWAFQLDWLLNGVRYHWNHAYNEDFKKHSPGKILLLKLLEASFKDPEINRCDHMRGAAEYKSKLADQFEPLYKLEIHNPFSKNNKLRKWYFNLSKIKTFFIGKN